MWRIALPLGLAVLTSNTVTAQLVTSLAGDTNASFERYIASAEPKITELARSNRPLPLLGEASVPKPVPASRFCAASPMKTAPLSRTA